MQHEKLFYEIYNYDGKTGQYSLRKVESKFKEGLTAFLLGAGVAASFILYIKFLGV